MCRYIVVKQWGIWTHGWVTNIPTLQKIVLHVSINYHSFTVSLSLSWKNKFWFKYCTLIHIPVYLWLTTSASILMPTPPPTSTRIRGDFVLSLFVLSCLSVGQYVSPLTFYLTLTLHVYKEWCSYLVSIPLRFDSTPLDKLCYITKVLKTLSPSPSAYDLRWPH